MKWWGLCWHLDRMRLNRGERDRERIVSNFSIAGVNRFGRFVVVKEFYVISNTSGRSQPMRIATAEDGYVRGSTVNPIPPEAEIECVTEFADERDETLTPRGMRPEALQVLLGDIHAGPRVSVSTAHRGSQGEDTGAQTAL
jgi:hypothetical protein